MKKSLFILFLIASLQSYSQVTVIGTVKDYGSKIKLSYWKDFNYKVDTIQLDKNNKFRFQYPIHEPVYIRMETVEPASSTPFFLVFPNESLEFVKDNTGVTLKGGLQQYNQFLLQTNEEIKTLFKNSPSNYNTLTEYLLNRSDKFFSDFKHPKREIIRDLHNLSIITNYKLYPILLKYSSDTSRMTTLYNFLKKPTSVASDDEFLRYFDRLDFNNENIRFVNQIDILMMNNFIRILRSQAVKKDSTLNEIDEYTIEKKIIKQLLKETPYRSRLLGYNLYFRIQHYTEYPMQLAGVDDFINDYKKEQYSTDLIPPIENLYTRNIATIGALAKGTNAPSFKLLDKNGKFVSLSDFKGKVVYLDVWASWCGPCLKEMPYLNNLKERFKDKEVEIISISIDTKSKEWLQKIADLKLGGIQLIDSKGSENSGIAQNYKIHGVPHFILIDRNGKIASAFAPRPSLETEVEKEINKLLE